MKSLLDNTAPDAAVGFVPAIVILPGGSCSVFCFSGLERPLPEIALLSDTKADSWRARSWATPTGYAGLAVVGASAMGNFRAEDPAAETVHHVGTSDAVSTEAADLAAHLLATGAPASELLHFLGEALSRVSALEGAQRFLADLLLQTSVADGYVEVVVRPEGGGLFLQGWTHSRLSGQLNLHGHGKGVGAFAATFERDDVQAPAAGFCIFAGDWRGQLGETGTFFVDHDQRLLRLDLLTASEPISGGAATEHVRAILPRLSAPPRSLEAFKRIIRPSYDGLNTLEGFKGPVAAAIDRILGTPSGGLFVSGWLLDPLDNVAQVVLMSTRGLRAPLQDRWHRADRPDLNKAFGPDPRFAGHIDPRERLHGFACTVLAEAEALAGAEIYIEVVLKDESCLFLPCEITPCDGDGGAHPVLEALQPDDPALKGLIANHAAPFLATVPTRPLNLSRLTVQPLAGGPAGCGTAAVMPLANMAHLQPVMASLADTQEAAGLDLVLVANREGAATLCEDLDHQFRFFGLRGTLVLVPGHETLGRRLDAGVRVAHAPEILLWQPAVLPKAPGWLAALRNASAELGDGAVVAPLLSYEDGSVYFGGGRSGAAPTGAPCPLVGFERRRLNNTGPRAAQGLPAEILLVKSKLLSAAGGFRGGLYGERFVGQDLSQRLKRAGAESWCVPEAEFWMLDASPPGGNSGARSMIDRLDAALISQKAARASAGLPGNLALETGGIR